MLVLSLMSGNLVKSPRLKAQLGTSGAVLLGLGSILGTGVFVSLAIATSVAGSQIFLALSLAAIVALCNALSAAQLAAANPVNGGTYAHGYRYLHPYAGLIAGWSFLAAKSASAATAALGLAGYLMSFAGDRPQFVQPVALVAVGLMTAIAALGVRKANWVNAAIVGWTIVGLGGFVVAGWGQAVAPVDLGRAMPLATIGLTPAGLPQDFAWSRVLQATALMFVAYAGYARITTMTEEVRRPGRSIPIAVVVCLSLALALYTLVAGTVFEHWAQLDQMRLGTAIQPPLQILARQFDVAWPVATIVGSSAIVALLGVLLNLILGLSRVWLAMGRQGDMPRQLAQLNRAQTTPTLAVWLTGGLIALLVAIGNVKTTWSFSAFNVLIYYTLTNLAALRLPESDRRYPRWIAVVGLFSCLSLAFWVERSVWQWGIALIAVGCLGKVWRDRG
jgi:basic amino acid/polyamine antiporter, APA family